MSMGRQQRGKFSENSVTDGDEFFACATQCFDIFNKAAWFAEESGTIGNENDISVRAFTVVDKFPERRTFCVSAGGTIIRINADNFVTVLPCEVQAEGFLLFVGSKVGPCGSGVNEI